MDGIQKQLTKRRRRRRLPSVVLNTLQEEFHASHRTICRRIQQGDKAVISRALELVQAQIEYHRDGKALVDELSSSLNELYTF